MEKASASVFDDHHRKIVLDDFRVGSVVEVTYVAPSTGRVTLNLKDTVGKNTVLHVDARYNWSSEVKKLVLNSHKAGEGWGREVRPDGFDFTPGIHAKVRITADEHRFIVHCNELEVGEFKYRHPVTSVNMVEMIFGGDNADQKAVFKSLALYFR